MKVQPWMLGVAALSVAGVGILIYETVKSKSPSAPGGAAAPGAAAAASPPLPAAAPAVAAPVPTLTAARPPVAPPQSFGVYPTGPALTLTGSGALSANLTSGQSLTLVLPAGAKWVGVVAGNTANPNTALGEVALGGDLSSPVSIPQSALVGSNVVAAGWVDKSGSNHITTVAVPLVTHVLALTLRA